MFDLLVWKEVVINKSCVRWENNEQQRKFASRAIHIDSDLQFQSDLKLLVFNESF